MSEKTVTMEIRGREHRFPEGMTILEACLSDGYYVPHFCWHEGLSTAGNCRMCQVEITMGERSRVDVACVNRVAEGLKIRTETEEVQKARRGTLEFLLLNHPLDCPFCDCAGECKLQNYYYDYGNPELSRFEEEKINRSKRRRLGDNLILDNERCILCTRCVRFLEEVTGTPLLGVRNLGSHSEIYSLRDEPVTSDYSGNVVDLCPVGALTDENFRFQRRVWYLHTVPSICTGCSRGCNLEIQFDLEHDYKKPGKRIQRLKPRFNAEINQWWLCNRGRYGYHRVDENRLLEPRVILDGELRPSEWDPALRVAGELLSRFLGKYKARSLAVLASPDSTNESLLALRHLFRENLEVANIRHELPGEARGKEDQFLMKADLHPNRRSCRNLELTPRGLTAELLAQIRHHEVRGLVVFRHDLEAAWGAEATREALEQLKFLLVIDTHHRSWHRWAQVLLPAAMWSEEEGTYTNFQGRTQFANQAFPPAGKARSEFYILKELARQAGIKFSLSSPDRALALLKKYGPDYARVHGQRVVPASRVRKEATGIHYDV